MESRSSEPARSTGRAGCGWRKQASRRPHVAFFARRASPAIRPVIERSSGTRSTIAVAGEMTGWRSTVIIELSQDSTWRLSEEPIVDVARAVTEGDKRWQEPKAEVRGPANVECGTSVPHFQCGEAALAWQLVTYR